MGSDYDGLIADLRISALGGASAHDRSRSARMPPRGNPIPIKPLPARASHAWALRPHPTTVRHPPVTSCSAQACASARRAPRSGLAVTGPVRHRRPSCVRRLPAVWADDIVSKVCQSAPARCQRRVHRVGRHPQRGAGRAHSTRRRAAPPKYRVGDERRDAPHRSSYIGIAICYSWTAAGLLHPRRHFRHFRATSACVSVARRRVAAH